MDGSRRAFLGGLIAAVPCTVLGSDRSRPPKAGYNLAETRRRAFAATLWPDHDVVYFDVNAPFRGASMHRFKHLKSRHGDYITDAPNDLGKLRDIMRTAQDRVVHLAVGGDNPERTANSIVYTLMHGELRPPLQLHLAFLGDPAVGEALRPRIEPVLLEFLVANPA